jgi:hypothetical protein
MLSQAIGLSRLARRSAIAWKLLRRQSVDGERQYA